MLNFINSKHSFHLVDASPWPIISAFAAIFDSVFLHMHCCCIGGLFLFRFGLLILVFMGFFLVLGGGVYINNFKL